MRKHTFLILSASLFLLAPLLVQARWATPEEMAYTVNFEKTTAKIKKNGSYVGTVESQIEILKESARSDQGMTRFGFNGSQGKIKILSARTINGSKTIPVPEGSIEIKPLASSGAGFDSLLQITIAYPEVNIGSKIYLKYEYSIDKPNIPGFFFSVSTPGLREHIQYVEKTFESEVPLYHEVHDPTGAIEVITGKNKVTFRSKKPLLHAIVEEDNSLFDSQTLTWTGVSTAASYAAFPKETIRKYADTMSATLPAKFSEIVDRVKINATDIEQINYVTSSLADAVRYVGDWRQVEGAFHPHSLAFIAAKGYGDCKDFTVATGAMLKRLGFEVHAAWLSRGTDNIFSPLKIIEAEANHAVLYAKKNGRVYWIDPTNTVSFAQGIFPDIENRPALVLFPDGIQRLKTTAVSADDGKLDVKIKLNFSKNGPISGSGELNLHDNTTLEMTGSQLYSDKKSLDYTLIKWATNRNNLLNWEFNDYNLKSRIVAPIKATFVFQEPWVPAQTTAGKGYSFSALNAVSYFNGKSAGRISALNLETPMTFHNEYTFTGLSVELPKEIHCHGNSEWVEYSRRIYKEDGAVIATDMLKLKVKLIPPHVASSKEFGKLQDDLISCMQNAVVIFRQ